MVNVPVKSFTISIKKGVFSVISIKFAKNVTKKRNVVFAINKKTGKLRKVNVFASQVIQT